LIAERIACERKPRLGAAQPRGSVVPFPIRAGAAD